jgi:hypothetical protein
MTSWTFGMMVCTSFSFAVFCIESHVEIGPSRYIPAYYCYRGFTWPRRWSPHVSLILWCRMPVLLRFRQALHRMYPYAWIFSSCNPDPTVRCISPGFYAVIGASAMLGGVTRMTSEFVYNVILGYKTAQFHR